MCSGVFAKNICLEGHRRGRKGTSLLLQDFPHEGKMLLKFLVLLRHHDVNALNSRLQLESISTYYLSFI